MSHATKNSIERENLKKVGVKNRGLTQDTRYTIEQVLDPRTLRILTKMKNRDTFADMFGCVSTGKEANVYHATRSNNLSDLAIKIFKTSILVFKDRAKYVEGEFRFRHGYSGTNPRKMVAQWAEKEARNLRRIAASGIRCPIPVELKQHVLCMTFLGKQTASPRLRDARLNQRNLRKAYIETVALMRQLATECKLVHGDLSEFNLLWHDQHVFVIDVSQSVEFDHPMALDFLKRDCINVTRFFERQISTSSVQNRNDDEEDNENEQANNSNSDDDEDETNNELAEFDKLRNQKLNVIQAQQAEEDTATSAPQESQWWLDTCAPQAPGESDEAYLARKAWKPLSAKTLYDLIVQTEPLPVYDDTKVRPWPVHSLPDDFFAKSDEEFFTKEEDDEDNDDTPEEEKVLSAKRRLVAQAMMGKRKKFHLRGRDKSALEDPAVLKALTSSKALGMLANKASAAGSVVGVALDKETVLSGAQKFAEVCRSVQGYLEERSVTGVGLDEDEDLLVWMEAWKPSSLNEVGDTLLLDEELDRRAQGESERFLGHLMKETRIMDEFSSSTEDDESDEESDDEESDDEEESDSGGYGGRGRGRRRRGRGDDEDVGGGMKFDGKIPDGIDPKEWKKLVKEANKEKRKHKIDKHVKKRYRKKAANR